MKYVVTDTTKDNLRHEFETEQQVIEFARTLPVDADQPNKKIETFKQATNHIQYGQYGYKNLRYEKEYTVEERLAQLRKENEEKLAKEERCLLFQERLMKLLGIRFMVVEHHDNDMHAYVELSGGYNKPDNFDRSKLHEYYEKLLADGFVPECRTRGTASKNDKYVNHAPAFINFYNHFSELCLGHTCMAEVVFTFKGCSVSFKMPAHNSFKGVHSIWKTLPGQERKKHPKGKHVYYMDAHEIGRINWYQSDYTMYAKDEKQAELLMQKIWGTC